MISRSTWFWISVAAVLIVTIVLGAVVAWSRYSGAAMVEISLNQGQAPDVTQDQGGLIVIDGDVSVPGVYPFTSSDTIATLVRAAGGPKDGGSLSDIRLDLRFPGPSADVQRININRADVWLLQALPGVGEILAGRIVDYRRQNGVFRTTSELTMVSGIGQATYEEIKDLISVSD